LTAHKKSTNVICKSKARNYSRQQTELLGTARRQRKCNQYSWHWTNENLKKWASAQLKEPELQGQSTA